MADETDHARCPACGSVVHERFQSCEPIRVDVTKPGYRYLADTWGYCLTLGRHVGTGEPNWLHSRLAQAWDEAVDAAFCGAVTRQNADDVRRGNPYRVIPSAQPTQHPDRERQEDAQ